MQSPLTGNPDCIEVWSVPREELIRLYRWQRGLDVSAEIQGDRITLWHDPQVDFYFFDPPSAGGDRFYRELTRQPLYAADKQEYRFAAANLEAGESLLDVGCGWGLFASHAKQARYKGIELSESAMRHCRANGLDVEQKLADVIADEHPDGFDVVTSFQVLEHVEDPTAFFADCTRNVRPGGRLIISVPNADGYMSVRENNYLNYPPHHVTWWTHESLRYLADQHRLEILGSHVDQAEGDELTMHLGAQLHRALSPERRGVRNGRRDRALLKACDGLGKILRRMPGRDAQSAHGHSITVVFRKPV